MRHLLLTLLCAVFAGSMLTSCCVGVACDACPSAVDVVIADAATGGAVPDVTIDGMSSNCIVNTGAGFTLCGVGDGGGPGTYDFEVGAAGYVPQQITAEVQESPGGGCCNCGYVTTTVNVMLVPM